MDDIDQKSGGKNIPRNRHNIIRKNISKNKYISRNRGSKTKNKKFVFSDADTAKFIHDEFPKQCDPYKYVPSIIGAKDRVVVFGDIHGDYNLVIKLLKMAKLVVGDDKSGYKWIGGAACVVQMGDQLDRCRPSFLPCSHPKGTINDEGSDIKIMELFNNLSLQAEHAGGAVISLLGNHELLNVNGNMTYVSYENLREFNTNPNDTNINTGMRNRIDAFKPGNKYGKMMGCTRLPAVIIGSNLFAHAGIIDKLIEAIDLKGMGDLEKVNIAIRRWLLGLLNSDDPNYGYVEEIIKYSPYSMFWSRILGKIPYNTALSDPICSNNITNVLQLFKAGSIIIGHTPQSFLYNEDINSTCSNKVWRVDNGSSRAFDIFDVNNHYKTNRRPQYLEIIHDRQFFVCDEFGKHEVVQNHTSHPYNGDKTRGI